MTSVASQDFIAYVHGLREKGGESIAKFKFNKKRVRVLGKSSEFADDCNGVLYWMSRDQRVQGEIVYPRILIQGYLHRENRESGYINYEMEILPKHREFCLLKL